MPRRSQAPPDGVLFQEWLRGDPFWMLVACQLVNLTTWRQARPAFWRIRLGCYGLPSVLASRSEESLHDALRPLGLWRRRAKSLIRLAKSWCEEGPPGDAAAVLDRPGCGRYASDSWAIFVDGRTDVEPDDGKLNWYMERLHGRGSDGEARQ